VRAHLSDDGLFCQWLPLHQLDLQTLRSIVAAYLAVFPQGAALLATNSLDTPTLGLIAFANDSAPRLTDVQQRLHAAPTTVLQDFELTDEYAVLGSLIASPEALRRFAADAPLNSDDHPVVSYLAPYATYAAEQSPRQRLVALLATLTAIDNPIIVNATPAQLARLQAYAKARRHFIEIGINVKPTSDVRAMLAQVREPLLDVLRISPDFNPARQPLLRMADALQSLDPKAAEQLRQELDQIEHR
jgi:spermidine synthase